MAMHNDLGKLGEELAEKWLIKKGFIILHRNFRYGKSEIDLIALKDKMPHFVEVKCRSSKGFGQPEESVTKKKIMMLLKAVDQYLYLHREYDDFRVDILSIMIRPGSETEYFFIEDVYV